MNSLRALLQFATIIPVGKLQDLSVFARRLYLFPVAGYVIGGIAALAVWKVENPALAGAIALVLVLILSGFHHFDGLLDLGDALMAQGNREKRIQALIDRQVGTGGVGLGFVVSLLSYGALLSLPSPSVAILSAEVCAKMAMAGMTIFGTPFKEGTHAYLHRFTRPWFIGPALLFFLPLLLFLRWEQLLILAMVTLGVMVVIRSLSLHLFGGVNGDVVGATNEIMRSLTLVALVLLR